MNEGLEELYDYSALRKLEVPTMFAPRLKEPLVVLGGSQSTDVLDLRKTALLTIRRRRGGGGLVLLQPDDLWVDWWIPAGDPRWSHDVHVSSIRCGELWCEVLSERVDAELSVHEGALEGERAHRVVCFAGKGPGEVFVAGRKAVGVTQWRVREGVFLSSVLHAHDSRDVLALLNDVPDGLGKALEHHVVASLGIVDAGAILSDLYQRWGSPAPLRRSLDL